MRFIKLFLFGVFFWWLRPRKKHKIRNKPHQTESGNPKPKIKMTELIKKIAEENDRMVVDLNKYASGNKAAGLRARKSTLALEKLYKEFRKRSVHESPVQG